MPGQYALPRCPRAKHGRASPWLLFGPADLKRVDVLALVQGNPRSRPGTPIQWVLESWALMTARVAWKASSGVRKIPAEVDCP